MRERQSELKASAKLVSYLFLSAQIPNVSDLKFYFCVDSAPKDLQQISVFYFLF